MSVDRVATQGTSWKKRMNFVWKVKNGGGGRCLRGCADLWLLLEGVLSAVQSAGHPLTRAGVQDKNLVFCGLHF